VFIEVEEGKEKRGEEKKRREEKRGEEKRREGEGEEVLPSVDSMERRCREGFFVVFFFSVPAF